jgi:hypothetical protein
MKKNLLPTEPPCWPNDRKRSVTKMASKTAATTATITPVMTPTNTSFALHCIAADFAFYRAILLLTSA